MAIERITAHGFWRHGQDFLHAADRVKPVPNSEIGRFRSKPSLIAYYLLGHSIELSLKSFLFAKGYTVEQLRRQKEFGHDLAALLSECRRRKLGREVKLKRQEIQAITLLSATYKSKKFEYLEYGTYNLPEYFFLRILAEKLVNGLSHYAMNPPLNKSKKAPAERAGTA